VVAITGRIAQTGLSVGDVLIKDWREAGLLKASLVKPVFTTVEQRLILRKLGALQPIGPRTVLTDRGTRLSSRVTEVMGFSDQFGEDDRVQRHVSGVRSGLTFRHVLTDVH